MEISRIHTLKNRLEAQIRNLKPELPDKFPLQNYIQIVQRSPRNVGYKHVSREAEQYCKAVLESSNGHILELYNKYLLLEFITKALESGLERMNLPGDVKMLCHTNFDRIVNEIEYSRNEAGFYTYSEDRFLKDLGISALKVIPAGAQKMCLCHLPMDFLFRKGTTQFINGLTFLLFELKGMGRFFSLHSHTHDPHQAAEFNADGWRRLLIRTSETLKLNPEVKGVYATSWFMDPQLERISPKICYVRHLLYQSGGRVFFVGPSNDGLQEAVFRSPTRKQLYDRGKYVPMDYMGIWPRKSLVTWADRQKVLAR